ncbi:MAG: helix-turn-helix domain-containing protein [Muribaculaceae bacterium]|nr:helix-turn-helix domain-containing protein [Muribaculaceae bacterium]
MLKSVVAMLLILLCTASFEANAQMRTLSTSDNLSDQLVNSIYKDSKGFVWFGTETGLDRFDGNQIARYRFPGRSGTSLRVNDIFDVSGNVYVANPQGLYKLTPGASEMTKILPDKLDFAISAISGDGSDLYLGTRQGVYVYNAGKNTLVHRPVSADIMSTDNEVVDLVHDHSGKIWALTPRSVVFLDPSTGTTENYPLPPSKDVTKLAMVNGMLYIGTSGGRVIPFSIKTRAYGQPIDVGDGVITSLSADPPLERLYISMDGEGVVFYDLAKGEIEKRINASSSPLKLRSNSVYSMLVDNQGLLWVGYYQMGVDYTPKVNDIFEVYTYPGFINTADYAVRAVAVNGSEKLIGTRDGLFYVNEATGRTAHFQRPDIRSNIIFCITRIGGKYYIGTYNGGMYLFDPATLRIGSFGNHQERFDSGSVFAIEEGPDGSMWVGASDGLHRFRDGTEVAHYTPENSQLPKGNVYELFFDSTGRGWVCTENGMAIWNGKNVSSDRFPKGFINKQKIRDVYEDKEHNLYFVPDRGDVYRSNLNLTSVVPLTGIRVSDNRMVTFITEDFNGMKWLGTGVGAVCIPDSDDMHLYTAADGIPHPVFTLCQPVADEDGNIWMGNTSGLLKLDPAKVKEYMKHEDKRITVTDLHSNGESIYSRLTQNGGKNHITLNSKESDLAIYAGNLTYINPEHFQIEYMLEGYDMSWQLVGGGKSIHYYDLQPGDYTLHLRLPGHTANETLIYIHKDRRVNIALVLILSAIGLFVACYVAYYIVMRRRRREEEEERAWEEAVNAANNTEDATAPVSDAETRRYRTTSLSDEECKRILKVIDEIMRKDRPFINPDLKSADLAKMAGTTSHSLSYIFNQYMKKSYYDYVNNYRVNEFKRLVAEEDLSKYTLTAMSKMCGFSSRSSFFRHFKNITGMTPAEYIKTKN